MDELEQQAGQCHLAINQASFASNRVATATTRWRSASSPCSPQRIRRRAAARPLDLDAVVDVDLDVVVDFDGDIDLDMVAPTEQIKEQIKTSLTLLYSDKG